MPGSRDEALRHRAAAEAVPAAEQLLLDGLVGETDRVFDDILPSPTGLAYGDDVNTLADMVAFLDLVPKDYDAAATRKAASDLSVQMAEEWVSRIRAVGKDRVAWAKKMRSKKSAGNYDTLWDVERDSVRFGTTLIKKLGAPSDLVSAYGAVLKAIAYETSYAPHAASTRMRGNTIVSTYTVARSTGARPAART